MKLSVKTHVYRRWLISALAVGRPIKPGTKLVVALALFLLSYSIKTLQAVDLAPVMYTVEQPFGGLTDTYDLRAVSILEGEGLLGPYRINPSRTVWIAQAPGYSIYLSAIYKLVGRDFFRVQLVQNALNSISPILLFLIAGDLLGWRTGGAAGLIAAASHHLSHISNFILPDSLSALPVLGAFYLLVIARRRRRERVWLYISAGVMLGLSAWLRSQLMLMGLFFLILLAITSAPRWPAINWPAVKRAALMAAASVLVIAPITIKNCLVYGEFVPINIGVGIVLWEGIAEASGDRFGAVMTDEEVARQEAIIYDNPRYAGTWSSPDGIKRDRDRVKKSLAIIVRHPLWYAGVILTRMKEMLRYSAHAPLIHKRSDLRLTEAKTAPIKPGWEELAAGEKRPAVGDRLGWMRPAARALQRITKEAMLSFILIGAAMIFIASWRRWLFIMMAPIYYLLFQSFIHTEFRYTLPMHYFLFIFAAVVWVLIGRGIWVGVVRLTKPRSGW